MLFLFAVESAFINLLTRGGLRTSNKAMPPSYSTAIICSKSAFCDC